MFVDLKKAEFKKLQNFDLFKQIYLNFYSKWFWKKRTEEELKNLFKNYQVLELEETILWWYALTNFTKKIDWEEKKWLLLENLFSSRNWWWIGKILWEKIIKEEKNIFAYSKAWDFFTKLWFKKIIWEKSETWADLWFYEKK